MRMQHCVADFSTLPLPADKYVLIVYSFVMLRFLTIILSVLSLAVVSFAAQVHETGMVGAKRNIAMSQHMEHAASSKASCAKGNACKTETALCHFVCSGISVFVLLKHASVNELGRKEKYLRSLDNALVATAAGMDDRPPIARLL